MHASGCPAGLAALTARALSFLNAQQSGPMQGQGLESPAMADNLEQDGTDFYGNSSIRLSSTFGNFSDAILPTNISLMHYF
jgi:hypothetical protein